MPRYPVNKIEDMAKDRIWNMVDEFLKIFSEHSKEYEIVADDLRFHLERHYFPKDTTIEKIMEYVKDDLDKPD